MKLNLFLVPSSKNVCSKKLLVKKIFSTILTTLALGGATLFFSSARFKPSREELATLRLESENDKAIKAIPVGLSRRRGAFNKAVEILSDAADENPHLADYLVRVKKRVKGTAADGDDSSGIQAVKPVRKVEKPAVTEMSLSAAVTPPLTVQEGLAALMQSVANLTQTVAEPDPGTTPSYTDQIETSTSPIQESDQLEQRFTVGDMTFDTNPAIEQWMNYYTATPIGRRTMTIGIDRSNSYLEMARSEFRNAGVPEDLVWLAFVESVWNPRAVSPAAAGGIWQFIPATATDYGLKVESGNDERADPLKQTRAAAIYLHDLYTVFGDWALAMAAYNSGEPRVMGAVVKNGRANFWDLYEKQLLPKETRDYVPKILAAITVASQADDYGFAHKAVSAIPSGS